VNLFEFANRQNNAIGNLANKTKSIDQELSSIYVAASTLQASLHGTEWMGEANNKMVAFMDLLLQYHGALSGDAGGTGPITQAQRALQNCDNTLESVYSSGVFRELEALR